MTKEEFNKLWKDSTKEQILNQYYYDYEEMIKSHNIIKEVRELNYKIQEDYSHQALFNNDFASGMYKASEMNLQILDKEKQNENI